MRVVSFLVASFSLRCVVFDPVTQIREAMVGDVGYSVGWERWRASFDDNVGTVAPTSPMGMTVEDVEQCFGSDMDVSDVLPEEEPDLGHEWRHWYMDDPELENDDETEVGVWKKTKAGGRLQSAGEGSDRSSHTVGGGWGTQGMKTRITRKNVAGRSRGRGSRGGGWFFDGRLETAESLGGTRWDGITGFWCT